MLTLFMVESLDFSLLLNFGSTNVWSLMSDEAISGGVNWEDAIRPVRDISPMAVVLMVIYVFITVFAVLNAFWPATSVGMQGIEY